MLQLRPNWSSLRTMDYYHQIFCRFRKCERKVPPPSPLSNDFEKSWFFSKILVTFFFSSLTKFFWPYKDFWSKISCIGTSKQKSESFEKIFINKIFKSWFHHVNLHNSLCSPPISNLMTPRHIFLIIFISKIPSSAEPHSKSSAEPNVWSVTSLKISLVLCILAIIIGYQWCHLWLFC